MKVCYITEMNFSGKIPRDYIQMRTEQAWPCTLEADCYHYTNLPKEGYDLAIIIPPKQNFKHWVKSNVINKLKSLGIKTAIMQEGPHWYFQDYDIPEQINYINALLISDVILCHNECDKLYYEGLLNKDNVLIMPSLMIEDRIQHIDKNRPKEGVIIGGNFVSWYGGIDSYFVAQTFEEKIYAPSMGRMKSSESKLDINHLAYLHWVKWINELSKKKYAVHLMRTYAAGTFALNCAYLGIPCIGYESVDTQRKCFPTLTVKEGDIKKAKIMAKTLKENKQFYDECSYLAKENYETQFKESIFQQVFVSKLKEAIGYEDINNPTLEEQS